MSGWKKWFECIGRSKEEKGRGGQIPETWYQDECVYECEKVTSGGHRMAGEKRKENKKARTNPSDQSA